MIEQRQGERARVVLEPHAHHGYLFHIRVEAVAGDLAVEAAAALGPIIVEEAQDPPRMRWSFGQAAQMDRLRARSRSCSPRQ